MAHHSACHHHPGASHDLRSSNRRSLLAVLLLVAGYMFIEAAAGLLTGSLALLADAGHMLSDAAALGLSLIAAKLAEKSATPQRTYGYYRTEVLAALVNGTALLVISVFILLEAYARLKQPQEVLGAAMMGVAAGGLLVNLAGLWILSAGRKENLNIRGAWLHMLTDMLGSVAAIAAGACVWLLNWHWIDAAASALIALLVIYSAWQLLLESLAVLMESAPRGIDVDEVRAAMLATPGASAVHDLHVWSITSGLDTLSAHVVIENGAGHKELLNALREMLDRRFGIGHVTIQLEPEDYGTCRGHP